MTRELILVLWSALALAAVLTEAAALTGHRKFAHLDEVMAALTRSTMGRVVFLLGWMWLGWHFFAR